MPVNVYTPTLPLVVGVDYKFPIFLLSQADTKIAKTNPTLAAGDFILFRKAAGALIRVGNLTTLPALIAGDTEILQVTILAAELPAGTQGVAIKCKDAADAEWCDLLVVKDVEVAAAVGTSDLVQADILSDATPFAGADIDAAISTRSTLTLANILAGVFEGTSTIQDFFRLASSVLFGKSTGGGTTNPKFRDLADTKDRVDATVTTAGDRTSVTRDAT